MSPRTDTEMRWMAGGRGQVRSILFVAAGLAAFFFPSSIDRNIQPGLTIVLCAIVGISLMLTFRREQWVASNLPLALSVLFLFALFTLLSPFPDLAIGGLAPYLLLLTVLLVDVRGGYHGSAPVIALLVINATLLYLGFGTVVGDERALWIVEMYYQQYDEWFFEGLVVWQSKPVTVFTTHSVAALAYFALFCLNLEVSRSAFFGWCVRISCFAASLGYLILLPLLTSNTGFAVFVPALGLLLWHCIRPLKSRGRIVAVGLVLTALAIVVPMTIRLDAYRELTELIITTVTYEGGGVLGRYTYGHRLQGTYDYLLDNNFLPIGLTYSPSIALGDNFIAEYILRISVFGYALILAMLWAWLRRNLPDGRSRWAFLLFFLAADLGYPLLPYPRAIGFLPLFTMLWLQARTACIPGDKAEDPAINNDHR